MANPIPSSPAHQKKEIAGIDLLRFFCAFSVMLSHLLPPIGPNFSFYKCSTAGVEIFFIISGFIIPYSAQGSNSFKFIRSRVVRLVPGVWICATISLAMIVLSGVPLTQGLVGKYIRSLLFCPTVPWHINSLNDLWLSNVYWTLFVEIAFYFIILMLLATDRFNRIATLATCLGSITLVYWSLYWLIIKFAPLNPVLKHFTNTEYVRYLDMTLVHHGAWFGLGINLWLFSKGAFSGRGLSTWICSLGCLLEVLHLGLKAIPSIEVLYCLVCIGFIVLSVRPTRSQSRSLRFQSSIRWIGLTTYPLYLLHVPVGLAIVAILAPVYTTALNATFIAIIFSIILAAFVARYLEPPLQNVFRSQITSLHDKLQGTRSGNLPVINPDS